jgi:hypothetical protein
VLDSDPDVGYRLPIPTDTMQIFDECRDGLILCKLINDSVPDTIDFRVLNLPTPKKPLNNFQITENNNIVITSAKAIGCSVVNIGSSDIAEGREHLILGLIWQIIRRGLLNNVDIKIHPELYRLCEDDETIDDLLRLTPDQILLRWFNYHLKAAGWHRTVKNFSKDVSDGENYTVLLNQLKPDECSRAPLQTKDLRQRAEQVLSNAERIGCRKYLTPAALVAGNPRLNLAFVANLFNTWPGLEPLEPGQDFGAVQDFDAEGEREARVFTLWLNSLGVEPGINNLFEDVRVSVANISFLYLSDWPSTSERCRHPTSFRQDLPRFRCMAKSFETQSWRGRGLTHASRVPRGRRGGRDWCHTQHGQALPIQVRRERQLRRRPRQAERNAPRWYPGIGYRRCEEDARARIDLAVDEVHFLYPITSPFDAFALSIQTQHREDSHCPLGQ